MQQILQTSHSTSRRLRATVPGMWKAVIILPGQDLPQHGSRLRLIALVAIWRSALRRVFRHYLRAAKPTPATSVARLAKIADGHRLTRARLSGGLRSHHARSIRPPIGSFAASCARAHRRRRGPRPAACESSPSRCGIGGQNDSASADPHGTGVWQLVMGRSDNAVADLREAATRDPTNARILNDLAVGLTEFAQRHDDPSALIDAFVAADSAVHLDRSLARGAVHARRAARAVVLADRRDCCVEPLFGIGWRSPWAAEARARLARLKPREDRWEEARERLRNATSASDLQTIRSIVAAYPSKTRALIQDQLGAWGERCRRRHGEGPLASRFRACARRAAENATGDALMVDAVAAIDRAVVEGSAECDLLAAGHAALKDGMQLIDSQASRRRYANWQTRESLFAVSEPDERMGVAVHCRARAPLQDSRDSALIWLTAIRDSAPPQYIVSPQLAAQYRGSSTIFVPTICARSPRTTRLWRKTGRRVNPGHASRRIWLGAAELRGREAGWRRRYSVLAATPLSGELDRVSYTALDYAGLAPRTMLRASRFATAMSRSGSHSGSPIRQH